MRIFASPNKAIVAAVRPFLPIAHLTYTGPAKEYAVFQINVRSPHAVGSGKNRNVACYGYIDVVTLNDPSVAGSVIGQIEDSLRAAGIHVLNVSDGIYEPALDPPVYHTEIEVIVRMEVADGG